MRHFEVIMTAIKKIIAFSIIVALLSIMYTYIIYQQFGNPVVAEWWLKNTIERKETISKNTNGERIVILSGSNGLFGINSKEIERITGLNVVNLSTHAGLDLNFYKWMLSKNIKEGDIVVIPLEYAFYQRSGDYSDWFIDNILAWGDEYFDSLSFIEKLSLISHTNYDRVLSAYFTTGNRKFVEKSVVDKSPWGVKSQNLNYTFLALNNNGDINRMPGHTKYLADILSNIDKSSSVLSYGKTNNSVSDYTLKKLKEINELVNNHHGKMFITWPASINTKFFNKNDVKSFEFTNLIEKTLNENSLNTICDHFYANLDGSLFSDTQYHLDANGALIRSKKLGECINDEIINGDNHRH